MRYNILLITLGVLAVLHMPVALADCNHPATDYERRDCERQREWDFKRGNSEADRAARSYLQQLERQAEEEARERRAEEERTGAQHWRPIVSPPGEYEGQRIVRENRERYKAYRDAELARIAAQFKNINYVFEQPAMGPDGYFFPVWMTVPFAGEMMSWAEKGYRKYPKELASLYGFMVAADPCADNPNEVGYPLSNAWDMSNIFYEYLNRYPECTYGRIYRAIPYLLEAQQSDFPPYRALACAQIEAWIARHFDNGVPAPAPFLFQGAVYNAGDYRYLSDKLAQCRAGLPHMSAFDVGLVQPAREWVKSTTNYFADVRLTRFYSRKVWAKVNNYDDPAQIRAVFDEVIKDYNAITLAHPTIFTRGIDQKGNGWHAFR